MSAEITTWLVPLVAMLAAGLLAGFAAGIFGIGGGFVVVPALLVVLPLLGGTKDAIAHVAIGTSAATIIVTSIRSLMSHAKRGAVEFEVLKAWAPWIILGCGAGVLLASHVDGRTLKMIFGGGVVLMSLNFLLPKVSGKVVSDTMPSGIVRVGIAGGLGTFSSLLGIGGGTMGAGIAVSALLAGHRGVPVSGYMAMRSEIDPLPAMEEAAAHGPVCVPVVEAKAQPLKFALWEPGCEMVDGPFGARVPRALEFIEPEILIVPLVAFSRSGGRLGYGGGFYDRTLERLRARRPTLAVGFAYGAQEAPALPLEPTDQPLDVIVTEAIGGGLSWGSVVLRW